MSLTIRIKEPIRDLCEKCRRSMILKDSNGMQTKRCDMHPLMKVPQVVSQCNTFLSFIEDSMARMQDTAWKIESRGGKVGFKKPTPLDD